MKCHDIGFVSFSWCGYFILEVLSHFYNLVNKPVAFASERTLIPFLTFPVSLVSPQQWLQWYLSKIYQLETSILLSFQHCVYREDMPFPCLLLLSWSIAKVLQKAPARFSFCFNASINSVLYAWNVLSLPVSGLSLPFVFIYL